MKKLIFLGGDSRTKIAYNSLKEKGFSTTSLGLFENDNGDILKCDTVIFPVPSTKDFKTVYCPLTDKKILFSDIKHLLKGKHIISGGKLPLDFSYTDILNDDFYAIQNAVPTAEGAISFCIENTPFTLFGSKVLVIGYGRVAKILVSRLQGFKCDITVSARKASDFAYINTLGDKYINTANVLDFIKEFDIVFNTIDVELFKNVSVLKDTLLIDLSTKGCTDFESARKNNIKAFKLPGIPAKTAPVTAGKILENTLYNLITKAND